jgi:hypothetical protein
MPVAYPTDLRLPLRASKSRSQPAAFNYDRPRRGTGYARPIGSNVPVFWTLTWRLTEAEAVTFLRWFTHDLDRGRLEFALPVRTEFGLSDYTCLFLPDDLMTAREEGALWTYTATVMARELVVPEPARLPAEMISHVEYVVNSSASSISRSLNVEAGHSIVVYGAFSVTSTTLSVSDSFGNSYTALTQASGTSQSGRLFYCSSSNAGGSVTITVSRTGGTSQARIAALSFRTESIALASEGGGYLGFGETTAFAMPANSIVVLGSSIQGSVSDGDYYTIEPPTPTLDGEFVGLSDAGSAGVLHAYRFNDAEATETFRVFCTPARQKVAVLAAFTYTGVRP